MEGQRVLLSVIGGKSGIGKGADLREKVHLEEAGMQLDNCPSGVSQGWCLVRA